MNPEWLDEDGVYPTDEALEKITNWSADDIAGCFTFMKDIWTYADCGYWHEYETEGQLYRVTKKKVYRYEISTGGWSGNESIIAALEKNWMIYIMTWVQSRRGGHYIFERTLV